MSAMQSAEQRLTSGGVYLPTCPLRGTAGSPIHPRDPARRSRMGCRRDRRGTDFSRISDRCRTRYRADRCVRVHVHPRLHRRRPSRPLPRTVHRDGAGPTDPVRGRTAVLSILHRERRHQPQGHPPQRCHSAGQPVSADVARHRGCRRTRSPTHRAQTAEHACPHPSSQPQAQRRQAHQRPAPGTARAPRTTPQASSSSRSQHRLCGRGHRHRARAVRRSQKHRFSSASRHRTSLEFEPPAIVCIGTADSIRRHRLAPAGLHARLPANAVSAGSVPADAVT